MTDPAPRRRPGRPGPRRVLRSFRIAEPGEQAVQQIADDWGVGWSEAVRRLVADGVHRYQSAGRRGGAHEPPRPSM